MGWKMEQRGSSGRWRHCWTLPKATKAGRNKHSGLSLIMSSILPKLPTYPWPTAAWRHGRLRNMAEELAPPSTSNSPEHQKAEGWIWSTGPRTITCRMWTFLETLQKSGNIELTYFMSSLITKPTYLK